MIQMFKRLPAPLFDFKLEELHSNYGKGVVDHNYNTPNTEQEKEGKPGGKREKGEEARKEEEGGGRREEGEGLREEGEGVGRRE